MGEEQPQNRGPILEIPLLDWLEHYRTEQNSVLRSLGENQAAGFAALTSAIDGKADKVDFERLSNELHVIVAEVRDLQEWRIKTDARKDQTKEHMSNWGERRNRLIFATGVVISGALGLADLIRSLFS